MKKLIYILLIFSSITVKAQVEKTSKLHKTLAQKDSLLFNEGLNKCNVDLTASLVNNNFEFYHDKGGITKGKDSFIKSIINGPCKTGVIQNKRAIVKGSLEVFPLYNEGKLYGAIQHGKHKFDTSTPKFTHLWLLENNEWKISRVLSYDH